MDFLLEEGEMLRVGEGEYCVTFDLSRGKDAAASSRVFSAGLCSLASVLPDCGEAGLVGGGSQGEMRISTLDRD